MKFRLADLLDLPRLQRALDSLYLSSKIPSAVIDGDGKILTGSGWQEVCTTFHRVHPEAEKRCIESDLHVNRHVRQADPPIVYRCPHGLVDAATAIIIEGEHLGNVFTGQLLLEEPDLDFFRSQARKYGFDEDRYIDAVRRVPVISRQALQENLEFVARLTEMLVEMGLKHKREREAAQLLSESEERFRKIFRGNSSVMLLMDPDSGRIEDANAAAAAFYGYPEDVLRAMTIDRINMLSKAEIAAERERVSRRERDHFIFPHRLAGGEVRTVEVHSSRVKVGGRRLVLSIVHDITERKRLEESLRSSEEHYRSLFENMVQGCAYCRMVFEGDRPVDFIYLVVNEAFGTLTGLRDVVGKKVSDVVPGIRESDPRLLETYGRVARTGAPERFEVRVEALGEWFSVAVHSPKREHFVAVFDVITERKRAEERLQETTRRLQLATSSGGIGIWDLDIRSSLLLCDDRMCELYGVERDAFPKTVDAWRRCLHPEDRAATMEALWAAVRGEKEFDKEFRVVHPGGNAKCLQASGVVVRDADGRALRMIGMNRDVTERRSLEQQLLQSRKMEAVGRLAGGVAHDFNNLLTAIIGNVSMALMKTPASGAVAGMLAEANKAADRAATLIRQLLAFSRKQIIEPKVVNLNELIRDLHAMLVRLIREDVEVRHLPGRGLGSVKIDVAQFQQVLLNLVVNARDAMPDGGRIVIETANADLDEAYCSRHPNADPGRYVMLAVSDTGCGMTEEVKAHIFEPFFTTKAKGSGTGLGLATTYGAVRQAGGSIEVQSEVGKGTTFRIYLPRVDEEASRLVREKPSKELPGGSETVLLVEDEDAVREMCAKVLETLGYKVSQAADGRKAIALCEERKGRERIDLLITDVVMPGMNGGELATQLVLYHPEMKVLFTSGYTEDVIVHHGVLDGDVSFIGKPYSLAALARKIRDVLDTSG